MHLGSKQAGFHVIMLVVAIVAVVGVGAAGYLVLQKQGDKSGANSSVGDTSNPDDPDGPPLKIKHIGIELDTYDPATNKAGDLVFLKTGLESYDNLLFFDYGAIAKANSAAAERSNPQPTFIVPLGTKIHSLVDGVVVDIPKLYSNDYSVMVASEKESQWIYELEHVINPTVKVGDTVKAGQVVAEASTHDSQYHPGFGLYEIGILHAGNPPEHVCPFNYLDSSIKDDVFAKLTDFYKSWETYMGDTSLYDESKHVVPGCYTLDPVEG